MLEKSKEKTQAPIKRSKIRPPIDVPLAFLRRGWSSLSKQVITMIRDPKATIAMEASDRYKTSPDMISQIANIPKSARSDTAAISKKSVIWRMPVNMALGVLTIGCDKPLGKLFSIFLESINFPAITVMAAAAASTPMLLKDLVITSALNIFQTPRIEIADKIKTQIIKNNAAESCICFIKNTFT